MHLLNTPAQCTCSVHLLKAGTLKRIQSIQEHERDPPVLICAMACIPHRQPIQCSLLALMDNRGTLILPTAAPPGKDKKTVHTLIRYESSACA